MRLTHAPLTALLVSCTIAAGAACGGSSSSDSERPPSSDAGGSSSLAGAGGKAGKAGSAGKGVSGSSGQSGSAGKAGGTAGTGTAGGGAGAAGATGGASGKGGAAAGQGGASGTGGKGGAAGSSAGAAGASGKGGSAGTAGASAGMGGSSAGCANPISLLITPPLATITVKNGVSNPVPFTATAVCPDGSSSPTTASWTFGALDIATVSANNGVVTAVGTKGGASTLTATKGTLSATADVKVLLTVDQNPGLISMGDQGKLSNPTGTGQTGSILYPYDQTVFARGILAPELMWNGVGAGDSYLVHVSEDFFDAKLWIKADAQARFQIDDATWNALTVSNHGENVAVSVTRLDPSGGQAPATQSWKIAQGSLRGTIYYWSVNQGQVLKIIPGASTPVSVFDSGDANQLGTPAPAGYNGATPPWEAGGGGKRCVACHTVSKDGTTLAAVFEKKGSTASPWGTVDTATGTIGQVTPYTDNSIYLALSPTAKWVISNKADFRMALATASNGAPVASAFDGFPDGTADPVFSPDGKRVAFASNVTGAYPVEYTAAGLDVMTFDDASGTLSARTPVLPKGQAIAFPSFSPGSDMIVYQKGDYSRANYGSGQHGIDDLFVTDLAGGLGEIRLGKACGDGVLDGLSEHRNYEPRVNPIAVGGYLWVVFVSPRNYGNRMVASSDASYDNHKQLWVAAVDLNPKPGADPSHPAFLLRGQDTASVNMSGYWTLAACAQMGASCAEGFECCSGFCTAGPGGAPTCSPPPTNGCSHVGDACKVASDCCADGPTLSCVGGFCSLAKP